jgi:hypothetical protein
VRVGDLKLIEKDLGHVFIVMLPGMNDLFMKNDYLGLGSELLNGTGYGG